MTHWKRPWCWERLKAGGEGDDRGWVGKMVSPTRWTWVWASSGSWWWTGKPGVLQSVGLQRVRHNWVTKLNWDAFESWAIKKVEDWRIDAFELWYWRILLRVPWTARRSNQSILKEIHREYSLKDGCWSWSSNTLATWWEEPTHWKRPWCWERLKAVEGDDKGWNGWMASPTQWMWVWAGSGRWWRTGKSGVLQCSPWGHKESDTTERLST